MRFLARLALLVTVVAITACMATTASATDTVQIIDEDTASLCGALGTPDQCHLHYVGVLTMRVDLVFFETNELTCNLEVEMRRNSTGGAAVDALEHTTGPDGNCATVIAECSLPWPGNGEEDGPTGVVQSNLTVCIDPAESETNCVGNLGYELVEQANEHYEMQFDNRTVGLCEFDVDLEIEHILSGNEEIHVNHPS